MKSKTTTDAKLKSYKSGLRTLESPDAERGQVVLLSTERNNAMTFARIGNGLFFATKKATRKTSLPVTPRVRFA